MKYSKQEKAEALARLRGWLKPGDTVYTILRNVSRSGMQREISVVILKDGIDLHPNHAVAVLLGERLGKRDGVIVGGCGMDMGFHLIYSLSRTLFPDGFAVVETKPCGKCQDRPGHDGLGRPCKHCGGKGVITKPARGRNGSMSGWDNDGGYALRHKWL